MSHKPKSKLRNVPGRAKAEWAKHLRRIGKKIFHGANRQAVRKEVKDIIAGRLP